VPSCGLWLDSVVTITCSQWLWCHQDSTLATSLQCRQVKILLAKDLVCSWNSWEAADMKWTRWCRKRLLSTENFWLSFQPSWRSCQLQL